jgi:hypothetical protein
MSRAVKTLETSLEDQRKEAAGLRQRLAQVQTMVRKLMLFHFSHCGKNIGEKQTPH